MKQERIHQISDHHQENHGLHKRYTKGLISFVCFYLLVVVSTSANAFEVGGSASGLSNIYKIVCKNKTADDKVVVKGNDSTEWNCEAAGLSIIEGHKVNQQITGRVENPGLIGGTAIGIGTILSVKCDNRTHRNKVYIDNFIGNSWNCSDAGLFAEPGDKIKQTIVGYASPTIINLPPLTPAGIHLTVGDGQLTLDWESVVNADFYKIYSSYGNNIIPSEPIFIGDTILPTFIHSGLTNGISYSYVIVASNNFGDSRPSNAVSAIPMQIPFDHTTVPAFSCFTCHNNIDAQGKTPGHILSSNICEACHTTSMWLTINVDHSQVVGACASCHNQPASHLATTNVCDACHATNIWAPVASVDHTQVVGNCAFCHNGVVASGKSAGHAITTDLCEACHLTTAWLPIISIDHNQIFGACASSGCHDFGKPVSHVNTTNMCEACHNVVNWVPVNVDHNEVLGACSSCHMLPLGHINVVNICEACHQTTLWVPVAASAVDHHQVLGTCTSCHSFPAGHPNTTNACEICHDTSQFPAWLPTAVNHTEVLGTCSTCHSLPGGHCDTLGADCNNCHTVTNWNNPVADCFVAPPPPAVPVPSPGPTPTPGGGGTTGGGGTGGGGTGGGSMGGGGGLGGGA